MYDVMSAFKRFRKRKEGELNGGWVEGAGNAEVFGRGKACNTVLSCSSFKSVGKQNMVNCSLKDPCGTGRISGRGNGAKLGFENDSGQHLASYISATDLLRSISERRKVFDKGATVSKEMQENVHNIAEAEGAKKYRAFVSSVSDLGDFGKAETEMVRLAGPHKGRRGIQSLGNKEEEKYYSTESQKTWMDQEKSSGTSRRMSEAGKLSRTDKRTDYLDGALLENSLQDGVPSSSLLLSEGVELSTNGSDETDSEEVCHFPPPLAHAKKRMMGSGANGEPISVSQRTEEETLELQVSHKQERVVQLRSFQRAIVDIEDRFDEERASREALQAAGHNATSDEHEEKMKARADRMQKVMRENFESLFDDAEDLYTPPEPSRAFSIENMAQTLGLLGKSLATIVEATDEICTSSTFKTEGEPVSIFLCTKALKVFAPYAKMLLELAMSHLSHFESGEKGILEGAVEEVNRLREAFLQSKDQLIIEEQKLKAVFEQRQSLLKRVRGTHDRCDMWEKVLLHREPLPLHLEGLEGMLNIPEPMGITQYLQHVDGGVHPFSSAGSPVRSSSYGSMFSQETPIASPTEVFHTERKTNRINSLVGNPLEIEGDHVEDAYEVHVAKSWGNPYVHKAKQYEKACANAAISRRLSQLQVPLPRSPIVSQQFLGTDFPSSPSGMSMNAFNMSETSCTSLIPQSLLLGRSMAGMSGSSEDGEYGNSIMQSMLARRLQLLQGLFRTIPATIFSDELQDPGKKASTRSLQSKNNIVESRSKKENKGLDTAEKASRIANLPEKVSTGDVTDVNEELRVETRRSIQRLIRYTADELKKCSGARF